MATESKSDPMKASYNMKTYGLAFLLNKSDFKRDFDLRKCHVPIIWISAYLDYVQNTTLILIIGVFTGKIFDFVIFDFVINIKWLYYKVTLTVYSFYKMLVSIFFRFYCFSHSIFKNFILLVCILLNCIFIYIGNSKS